MCRFIETIQIYDGRIVNVDLHQERLVRTIKKFFPDESAPQIENRVEIPEAMRNGLVKCRIVYSRNILSVDFERYAMRKINSLEMIVCNNAEYSFKREDRSFLTNLKGMTLADEVIIVRDGLVTDTTYTNIVVQIGSDLLTPAEPLLRGVQREFLLRSGAVKTAALKPNDLLNADRIFLINAMISLGKLEVLPECIR